MRLFLSSQGLGTAPGELVGLLRSRTRIAVIANGAYLTNPGKQRRRIDTEVAELRELGLDPGELDLRDYFGQAERLRAELEDFDALWVLGGNGVVLRTAFSESGADSVVRTRLEEDSLVYAGYSAGACLVGPAFPPWNDLSAEELPGYPDRLVTTGLDLVPFTVAPHQGTESGSAAAVVHYLKDHHVPFIALRDGQAIVIEGGSTRVVGTA